ncbi:MAG: uracil-DNA glycosylase [Acidobacteriota bacterium]
MSGHASESASAYLRLMALFGARYVKAPGTPAAAPIPARTPAAEAATAPEPRTLFASEPVEQEVPSRRESLDEIRADVGDCTRCKLCDGRRTIVFGDGNAAAELMFVGEGPGADEDAQGLPFVGAAGQLLNKIIGAMGFARGDVRIANVVMCRPPKNRVPEEDEIAKCSPFVVRQVESIRPRVVVALGLTAAQTLTHSTESMGRMRGKIRDARIGSHATKLMATYHPAYLLRSPEKKRDVWEDMKQVMALLRA